MLDRLLSELELVRLLLGLSLVVVGRLDECSHPMFFLSMWTVVTVIASVNFVVCISNLPKGL